MPTTQKVQSKLSPASRPGEGVSLYDLGLQPAELAALCSQGHLEMDTRRGGEQKIVRLRFRMGGRKRTIYVGCESTGIAKIASELAQLQAAHKQVRQLKQVTRRGRIALRAAKAKLVPLLPLVGLHYHGNVLRTARRKS